MRPLVTRKFVCNVNKSYSGAATFFGQFRLINLTAEHVCMLLPKRRNLHVLPVKFPEKFTMRCERLSIAVALQYITFESE